LNLLTCLKLIRTWVIYTHYYSSKSMIDEKSSVPDLTISILLIMTNNINFDVFQSFKRIRWMNVMHLKSLWVQSRKKYDRWNIYDICGNKVITIINIHKQTTKEKHIDAFQNYFYLIKIALYTQNSFFSPHLS